MPRSHVYVHLALPDPAAMPRLLDPALHAHLLPPQQQFDVVPSSQAAVDASDAFYQAEHPDAWDLIRLDDNGGLDLLHDCGDECDEAKRKDDHTLCDDYMWAIHEIAHRRKLRSAKVHGQRRASFQYQEHEHFSWTYADLKRLMVPDASRVFPAAASQTLWPIYTRPVYEELGMVMPPKPD
ncbi:hypothetical protein Rhopal_007419-T1 [Rhodotorula paludigena]|uniref:Uncharacterized protein n=1 Tax=Rhodotorula paludigena TaxID=86838 RepID=A0AAV5GWK9_9BASI|nr:hypothetical protein Rhopal_007419-T1 [Rhodotorula paludigena]